MRIPEISNSLKDYIRAEKTVKGVLYGKESLEVIQKSIMGVSL
jgi:hypothetical protein